MLLDKYKKKPVDGQAFFYALNFALVVLGTPALFNNIPVDFN